MFPRPSELGQGSVFFCFTFCIHIVLEPSGQTVTGHSYVYAVAAVVCKAILRESTVCLVIVNTGGMVCPRLSNASFAVVMGCFSPCWILPS